MAVVNCILQHPDIWRDIAPIGVEPFDAEYYDDILYFLFNWTDGVIIFEPFRDGMKIHPNIMPEKRGKKAFEAIEESIEAVFAMGCRAMYAEIDPLLRHVTWCAYRMGFKPIEQAERTLFVRHHYDG